MDCKPVFRAADEQSEVVVHVLQILAERFDDLRENNAIRLQDMDKFATWRMRLRTLRTYKAS